MFNRRNIIKAGLASVCGLLGVKSLQAKEQSPTAPTVPTKPKQSWQELVQARDESFSLLDRVSQSSARLEKDALQNCLHFSFCFSAEVMRDYQTALACVESHARYLLRRHFAEKEGLTVEEWERKQDREYWTGSGSSTWQYNDEKERYSYWYWHDRERQFRPYPSYQTTGEPTV